MSGFFFTDIVLKTSNNPKFKRKKKTKTQAENSALEFSLEKLWKLKVGGFAGIVRVDLVEIDEKSLA